NGEEQESLGDVDRQLRDDDQLAIRRYARGQEVAVTRPHLLDPAPRLVSRDRLGSTKRRSLIDETGPSWLRLRRTGHLVLVERTETRSGPGRVAALPGLAGPGLTLPTRRRGNVGQHVSTARSSSSCTISANRRRLGPPAEWIAGRIATKSSAVITGSATSSTPSCTVGSSSAGCVAPPWS